VQQGTPVVALVDAQAIAVVLMRGALSGPVGTEPLNIFNLIKNVVNAHAEYLVPYFKSSVQKV
jgi:hypothetical protein